MPKVSVSIDNIFQNRVISIVENFLATDRLLEHLDRDEMVGIVDDTLRRNYTVEQLQEMTDKTLTGKIRRILGGQVMFGLLSDLTGREIEEFDTAVRGLRKSY
ncbi:hypothetical protein ACP6PL_18670 [Dapis sp. BLCC M126]|uniref:hypothetical protein n=1 Tax=Dapis sp. BLCC M126 TaxID=3400189 RepID=UPI003CEEFC1E